MNVPQPPRKEDGRFDDWTSLLWSSLRNLVAGVSSVCGKVGDVTLVPSDVGAAASAHGHALAIGDGLTTRIAFTTADRLDIIAGTNVTLTYDDTANALTIASSGGGGGGAGTVTSVSVATANGFAGTVADPTTTPSITVSTSVTGLLKGNGTAVSAAVAGTDYAAVSHTHSGYAATGAVGSSGLTMTTARLLGRTTAGTGVVEEVTIGSGLSLSANVLSASGGGGSLTFLSSTALTGATVDVGSIPATANRIHITLVGVTNARASTNGIGMQLGTSTAFQTTGYTGSASVDRMVVGTMLNNTDSVQSTLIMSRVGTGNAWSVTGSQDSSLLQAGAFAGHVSLSAALTRLRFTTTWGDAFTAGTVHISWST